MSYEPLHHKYRPQAFQDLVGQTAIASTLINAIELGKIAPAYLFTGSRGTGKTSSARILAKSLNCLAASKPTANPCGECEVCRGISAGNALDTIEIDAASNTGVDNIREIIERSRFAPVQSRYKVYAIDECHMLSTAAFNALLKTLEEPPPRVVFILATTDPQRVLPTIISRCQRFDFRRIPLDAMVKHLQYIGEQEKIAIDLEALTLVAQIANGGLRDAESLLDQLSLFPDTITVERVWDLVGVVPERDLLALLTAIRKQDVEAILAQCRSLLDKGREPLVLLQNLASFYLNLLITKTAPSRQDLIAVTETCRQQLVDEAQYWDIGQILQGQQHLKEGEVQIKHTTQPRLWLEVTLLGLLERAVALQKREQQLLLSSQQNSLVSASKQERISENIVQNNSEHNLERKVIPFPNSNAIERELKSNFSGEALIVNKEDKEVISISPQQSINDVEIEVYRETKEREFRFKSNSETSVKEQIAPATNSESAVLTAQQASIWQQVIDCIHPPMTQALLRQQCHLINLEESTAVVGISSAPLLKMNQGKIPNIEVAFAKVCQRKVKVFLEVSPLPEQIKKNSNPLNINSFQTPAKTDFGKTERSQDFTPPTSIKTDSELTKNSIPIQKDNVALPLRENTELAIKEQIDLTSVTTSRTENSDDFIKAVELMAKKFDGEVIELRDSLKITASSDKETTTQESTTKPHQVIIKREAIVDYDDDVPF